MGVNCDNCAYKTDGKRHHEYCSNNQCKFFRYEVHDIPEDCESITSSLRDEKTVEELIREKIYIECLKAVVSDCNKCNLSEDLRKEFVYVEEDVNRMKELTRHDDEIRCIYTDSFIWKFISDVIEHIIRRKIRAYEERKSMDEKTIYLKPFNVAEYKGFLTSDKETFKKIDSHLEIISKL